MIKTVWGVDLGISYVQMVIGETPRIEIPPILKYACSINVYPEREGIVKDILLEQIDDCRNLVSCVNYAKPGDLVYKPPKSFSLAAFLVCHGDSL